MEKSSIESHIELRKNRTLVLFPLPFQGHINPMFQLANVLYSKGFSIAIIHTDHFNPPTTSPYPQFTFYSFSDGLSENEASSQDIVQLLTILNTKCADPFQDCLANVLVNVKPEEPVACLITDVIWNFTNVVAEKLRLPRIILRTSSIFSFLAITGLPLLRDKGYIPIQDSQLEAYVQENSPLKFKDLPLVQTLDPEKFYKLIAGMVKQIKTSSGVIFNSVEELEKDALTTFGQEFPIPVFSVGPFHKHFTGTATSSSLLTQDQNCIPWLGTQAPNSVLYVSFGSIAVIKETEFLEIAWGLANSNQPFLWVVRPRLVYGSEWLEHLPDGFVEMVGERGLIVKWAPQQEVLAHPATGGFWTHNGWNSTLESICEGVPMICMPNFGDQMVNARYVSDVWRIGINLEGKLERMEIVRVVKRLMVEEEGMEMRERIIDMKGKLNLCLSKGGSSSQSLENLVNYILSFHAP